MKWDFSLRAALAAMTKTAPFVVLRLCVYFGIALLYVVATGTGSGIGYAITSVGEGEGVGAGYGALFGFAGASGLLYWAREYILYLVKAGHIAVLVRHFDGAELPAGKSQIEFAQGVVRERFTEASLLFGVDQLVKGVLKVITRTLNAIASILPITGLDNLARLVGAVVRLSLTYVDEIILAQLIRANAENPWDESRRALVLYAQNYSAMLKNAVWLALMMWALTIVVFVIALAPAAALIALFPGDAGYWGVMVAFIFAWSAKSALIEPVAMYALMQVYFKKTEGQQPNPEWELKLDQASAKFRALKEKALNVATRRKADDPTDAAPVAPTVSK